MTLDIIKEYLSQHQILNSAVSIAGVLVASFIAYLLTKLILVKWLAKLITRTKTTLDDSFLRHSVLSRISFLVPVFVVSNFLYLFGGAEDFLKRLLSAVTVFIILVTMDGLLSVLVDFTERRTRDRQFQVKTYIQIGKILLYVIGLIVIIAVLIGQSPLVLLSGIGALTAVLLLVFRDTILSFVASLQISSYDLVKIGDWIEVPKYGADGDVIDIALHTIKIQNWDKTITVIPTHKLIEESFKNWRGMTQSGGRRIKRAIHIDISSVRFCSEEMLDRFEKISLISEYICTRRKEVERSNAEKGILGEDIASGRHLTNLGVFRVYMQSYLKNHPKISANMTFLVRQLAPGPEGLPIEIYVFTNDTEWVSYEAIQADVFDHLVAAISVFELSIFQQPSGSDIGRIRLSG